MNVLDRLTSVLSQEESSDGIPLILVRSMRIKFSVGNPLVSTAQRTKSEWELTLPDLPSRY